MIGFQTKIQRAALRPVERGFSLSRDLPAPLTEAASASASLAVYKDLSVSRDTNMMRLLLPQLQRVHEQEPFAVAKLMTRGALERARTLAARHFADAFVLWRDKKDRG